MQPTQSTVLVAVDLDQTLIYSGGSVDRASHGTAVERGSLLLVETHHESGARSYVSQALQGQLDVLRAMATVVPVTTRTRVQFERVAPLGSIRFDPSVCANGAILLVNGEPDPDWAAEVNGQLTAAWTVEQARESLDRLRLSRRVARLADGVFCYLTVDDVEHALSQIEHISIELERHGWSACLSGRKLYALPTLLTKAAAVERLARRLSADVVVAIGDSILDLPMLKAADFSIAPAHADSAVLEIANHVTPSIGPPAAIEALGAAVDWLSSPVTSGRRSHG